MSKRFYYSKASDEILFSFNLLHGRTRNLKAYKEELDKMLKTLDDVMDKPLSEDNPKYCCGDSLEKIRDFMESIKIDLDGYRDVLYAKALSFEAYPDCYFITNDDGERHDISEDERNAFVNGFLKAVDYCERDKKPIGSSYEKD